MLYSKAVLECVQPWSILENPRHVTAALQFGRENAAFTLSNKKYLNNVLLCMLNDVTIARK